MCEGKNKWRINECITSKISDWGVWGRYWVVLNFFFFNHSEGISLGQIRMVCWKVLEAMAFLSQERDIKNADPLTGVSKKALLTCSSTSKWFGHKFSPKWRWRVAAHTSRHLAHAEDAIFLSPMLRKNGAFGFDSRCQRECYAFDKFRKARVKASISLCYRTHQNF